MNVRIEMKMRKVLLGLMMVGPLVLGGCASVDRGSTTEEKTQKELMMRSVLGQGVWESWRLVEYGSLEDFISEKEKNRLVNCLCAVVRWGGGALKLKKERREQLLYFNLLLQYKERRVGRSWREGDRLIMEIRKILSEMLDGEDWWGVGGEMILEEVARREMPEKLRGVDWFAIREDDTLRK